MDGISKLGTILNRRLDHERSGCVTVKPEVVPKLGTYNVTVSRESDLDHPEKSVAVNPTLSQSLCQAAKCVRRPLLYRDIAC